MKVIINGLEVTAHEGQTILKASHNAGISIPSLCHDERVKYYGGCGICIIEASTDTARNKPRLLRACSTPVVPGMIINTDSEPVRRNRKFVLELLLSDHKGDCRPPCMLACPAETDCQGYLSFIAAGRYDDALKLIYESNPFPASIGRVCPRPCEKKCRRSLVEEPIAIAALKQYAADSEADSPPLVPAGDSGKSVAVIGGGPGGLSAAYFLRLKGHALTVFDMMSEPGGMLRYGIPEYRLPKAVLQREIDIIEKLGVKILTNMRLGCDITINGLMSTYDAVIIATGAWSDTKLRCKGDEVYGIIGGIELLRDVAQGNVNLDEFTGKNIAVVGGGNTAMDVCRTAVRLNAERVYNIYRRTKNEMPAEPAEIREAEEEGVIFKNLTNPIEIISTDGTVNSVRLQIMELGEPDSSGRRAPVPIEGSEELLEVDMVVSAIGQRLCPAGLEDIKFTEWGTIKTDPETFYTGSNGIFAIGDAVNNGADIAISAIGHARKAAGAVHRFLNGDELSPPARILVNDEKTAGNFADRKRIPRVRVPHRTPGKRRRDFTEVSLSLCAEDAKREASRCLKCGCADFNDCKLIKYANQYTVNPNMFAGEGNISRPDSGSLPPNIAQDPYKCILCGLCVRLCDEVVGAGILGFVNRGFDTVVQAAGDVKACENCGKCAAVCPTGALIRDSI